ncbi:asparagine synthase (glutamine-hydrolyzing), partial [Candidatus Pelagibacter sp.]|nr:asparagine synthase (glutamine-hydrolyzing) [Candidatus Pelagibacter sp.]
MCGISGYFDNNLNSKNIVSVVDKMNFLQSHRGPNSSGKFINNEKNFCFKMCRLSILDLELGIQPMHSNDNRYVIIFNGTILNSPELRKKLITEKVKFYTKNSDTEVLLNIIIKYGIDGIKLLNGSFAFSFYDKKEKKILCARDRFGLAPFYYLYKNNQFLFASELKSILLSGLSSKEINKQNLYHYLSLLWSPGPETIIKDIQKLQPGHYLELNLTTKNFKISKWFQINFEPDEKLSLLDWQQLIFEKLEKSVINSTLSDVPLSCGLSGGLDSQTIVGILSKKKKKINTFSLGFSGYDEGPLNELNEAREASEFYETDHQEIIIDKNDYFEELDKMIYHLDEPYGGGLPLWHIFKEAGKKFGVILTGLGGDELFGNFGRWTLLEKTNFDLFNNYYQYKFLFFDRKYFFSDELKNKLLLKESYDFEKTSEFMFNKISNKSLKNIRDKICHLDLSTQLPDEYCNMTNKFSMANQIEA